MKRQSICIEFRKLRSTCTGIKIGNGAVIPVEFVFPVQIMIQGHLFEIYTIVAALHENIDLVIGMKNMVELEGICEHKN